MRGPGRAGPTALRASKTTTAGHRQPSRHAAVLPGRIPRSFALAALPGAAGGLFCTSEPGHPYRDAEDCICSTCHDEQARVGLEVQTTMQDVMFTAEGLGKLLFIVGVIFFYAILFAVTRSSRTVWTAAAIGAVLLFGFVVTAHS